MSDKAEEKPQQQHSQSHPQSVENGSNPATETETAQEAMDDPEAAAVSGDPEPDTRGDVNGNFGENDEDTGGQTVQVDADELVQLRADVQRFRDLAMRTTADLENYRKRMAREKDEAVRYANLRLFEDLLPVIDSFELGMQAAEKSADQGALLQGMQMVYRQILDFLERNGVEKVHAVGEEFDPRYHEAMSKEPHDEVEEGRIVRQIRNGYKMGDRLLRAANVVVSSGPQKEEK